MSWRTIMRAGKSPEEKFTEPTKPSTESTKPKKEEPEHVAKDVFVDIVDQSACSQNSIMSDSLPFRVRQPVAYRVPDPQSKSIYPAWQEHRGTVLQVDAFREMVLIQPITEHGTSWRWVARCYVQVSQDEK
jgi:hypothetical protein